MEKFEFKNTEVVIQDEAFFIKKLGFENDKKTVRQFYRLTEVARQEYEKQTGEPLALSSPDALKSYFDKYSILHPEAVLRPKGDTTIFTTAGVQRIESMLCENAEIKSDTFVVAQPVIRSQFLDKVKEGMSTSFVDCSVENIGATPDDLVRLHKLFVSLLVNQGIPAQNILFTISESVDQWGEKRISKRTVTFYVNDIEIGECVYIPDYPLTETSKISVADMCFGVERLCWGLRKNDVYFEDFKEFYPSGHDRNEIAGIIDSIRTAVLIACEGVKPSHKDPGYRLRLLMTRFFSRNKALKLETEKLVAKAYEYWKKWGIEPLLNEEEVLHLIQAETERAYNARLLLLFKELGGPDIYLNVNQASREFVHQLRRSRPNEADIIHQAIQKLI